MTENSLNFSRLSTRGKGMRRLKFRLDRKWRAVVLLTLLLVEFVVVTVKIGSGILKLFRYFRAIRH